MKQTSLPFEEESKVLSPLERLSLPKDKDLPPVIREIVTNAPQNRKIPAFIASLSPLCAMCPRVRLHYYYDTRPSALLLQVLIEGAQSSGKSFAADIESLIMDKTLKARDKAMRRLEQEYRDKKKRRKANEKLEEEPQTTVRVVPPTISKTVLTKRADLYERVLGDTLTFWMFAEELAQVTDAGKNGYSNLRTIMRTSYDLGSLFGIDFASDNSYSAIVDINICSMFCATPAALDEYFDKKAIEGGNRANVGKQTQTLAHSQQSLFGTHLCSGVVIEFGITNAGKENSISIHTRLESLFGEGVTHFVDGVSATQGFLVRHLVAKLLSNSRHNGHTLFHNLRSDAITGQNSNLQFHL
jgi:hypothetical protein